MVERALRKRTVAGSNPAVGSLLIFADGYTNLQPNYARFVFEFEALVHFMSLVGVDICIEVEFEPS